MIGLFWQLLSALTGSLRWLEMWCASSVFILKAWWSGVGVATTVATSTLDSCQSVYRRKENTASSALKFLNAGCQNIHQGILKADFAKRNKCACLFLCVTFAGLVRNVSYLCKDPSFLISLFTTDLLLKMKAKQVHKWIICIVPCGTKTTSTSV